LESHHRILIVDDHRILREGLKMLITSNPAMIVVGEAENGLEAVRAADKLEPDLILIDLSMPRTDGLEAIREIKRNHPGIRILVLTVHKAEEYVFEALKSGADGYLLKDATHAELKIAVESVLSGNRYISPGISEPLVTGYLDGRKPPVEAPSAAVLTRRERQVLKMIAEGLKNKEIAGVLCISVKTVEKHRSNLMGKLDLHNVSELTAYAISRGIAMPPD
jgi:DNA-binding NarL/FixJ family response regulator